MHRKCFAAKNRWLECLMVAAMVLGGQLGVGLTAGSCRTGLGSVGPPAEEASARDKRSISKTPAGQPVPKGIEAARSFAGKRDPFRVPSAPREGTEEQFLGPLPPGKRGLIIGQLRLKGVVRQDAGKNMIAVVANQTNRAYFLRVHDEVYNGVVSEITADSIRFSENRLDKNGRVDAREIVLKLGAPPGEGR